MNTTNINNKHHGKQKKKAWATLHDRYMTNLEGAIHPDSKGMASPRAMLRTTYMVAGGSCGQCMGWMVKTCVVQHGWT